MSVVVKWSGSKRSQAKKIIEQFPKQIDTYYEPFCGGCSVLFELLNSKEIKVNNFVCSDIDENLINLFNSIKFDYNGLKSAYRLYDKNQRKPTQFIRGMNWDDAKKFSQSTNF